MAVFPPPEEVAALRRVLPAGSRLTRPSGWHVTLVFLGDVDESAVVKILDAVEPPGRFGLRLVGGGQFGAVCWAGLAGNISDLMAFRETVRAALAAGGFPSDERPFQPHLTVSYRGDPALVAAMRGYAGGDWTVESFALVSSVSGEYRPVRIWPLAGVS